MLHTGRILSVALAAALFCMPAQAQAPAPVDAQDFVGNARIVDTDILEVNGQRFHLYGIDAPDQEQRCFNNGRPWDCGHVAYREMEKIIFEEGGQVNCTPREERLPRFSGVAWATCIINGKDIAELLVRRGAAVVQPAQSTAYAEAEKAAEKAGVGMWQGPFILPWEWRERQR